MDRREFLRFGAGALGALAVPGLLQACATRRTTGGGSSPSPSPTLPQGLPEPVQALIDERVKAGARAGLDVFQGGQTLLAGIPANAAFVVGREGIPAFGNDATIWLVPDPEVGSATSGPLPAPYHAYAKATKPPAPQGVNAARFTFDRPGYWYLVAEADVEGEKHVGGAVYEVQTKENSTVPFPGMPAHRSETPTVDNPRGVNPICTREPACDLHQVTLAAAIGTGKPVVFEVGTPKFCSSQVCGPNLDEVLVVRDRVGGEAVFVHADVYVDDKPETIQKQKVAPTYREWGLRSEPWLFIIDRKGVIAEWYEGPLPADLLEAGLTPLL
jgi:hypothetical protein